MKHPNNKNNLLSLALLLISPLSIQTAQAVSTFSSLGTVTYTINNITNQNDPGNTSGLDIEGLFELDASQTFNNHSGDGSVTPFPTTLSSTPVVASIGNSFSKTFQLNGSVTDGTVDTNYLSLIDLHFENNSSNIFDIEVLMSHSLSASVTGDQGHTSVAIDYTNEDGDFNEDADFVGFESIEADASPLALNNISFNDTDTLIFTLAPGDFRGLFSEISIDGSLASSPVPLPAAIWMFGSALLVLPGIKKLS